MDDALAHSVCCHMRGGGMVLILVVMDDALAPFRLPDYLINNRKS